MCEFAKNRKASFLQFSATAFERFMECFVLIMQFSGSNFEFITFTYQLWLSPSLTEELKVPLKALIINCAS